MSFDKQNDDILVSLARSRARADKIYKNIVRAGINFSLIETRVSKP
jgi:hypothetical protein